MTPDQKYLNDPAYHTVVDILRNQLRQFNFTPTELREMVMLACTMHEMEIMRPIMVAKTTWYPVTP